MNLQSHVLSFKKSPFKFENKELIIAFTSIFSGLILGVIAYITLSESKFSDLLDTIIRFNTDFSDKNLTELFCGIALSSLPYYLAMFILGGSIFGRLFSEILTTIKAMGISIITSFLYSNMGLKGVEYALLIFFPGKIILIFALLLATVVSLEMSKKITNNDKTELSLTIKNYVIKYSIILLLFVLSWSIDLISYKIFSDLFN